MKETIKIPVVVRVQDNGDGGYSVHAYNTEQELLDAHHKYEEAPPEDRERVAREILNEDDPYENGYISRDAIEIEVIFDGTTLPIDPPKLSKPLHFHVGQ